MYWNLLLLLALIYLLPCYSYSQANVPCSTVTFQKEIIVEPVPGYDYALRPNQLIETLDSNIVISGRLGYWQTSNPTVINHDSSYISKLDKEGNTIWFKTFIDSSFASTKIFELPDSNFILYCSDELTMGSAIILTKLDKNGNFVWQKIHSASFGNIGWVSYMNAVSDGGFIATGLGIDGVLICKFDNEGNLLWYKDYEREIVTGGWGISNFFNKNGFIERDNGYIIMDIHYIGNSSHIDAPVYIMKIHKITGDVIWSKAITEESSRLYPLGIINNENDIIIASSSYNNPQSERGISFIKIDDDGNFINNVNLPRPFPNFTFNRLNEGIIGVLSDTSNNTNTPYSIFQLNKDLTIDWAKKYTIDFEQASVNQYRPTIIQKKDSNIYAIVNRKTNTSTSVNSYLLKTDKTGNAGSCEHINFNIPLQKPIVTIADIPILVFDYPLLPSTGNLYFTNKSVVTNIICTKTSFCDNVSISGNATVCNLLDSIEYTITRNAACFTSPIWKLGDTSYGNIVVYSDSSIKIKFSKIGQVKLYATIPTNCGDIKDSIIINIFPSASSLNIGNDFGICGDSTVLLQAGDGFVHYLWHDGSTGQNFSTQTHGIYYVTVTDFCNNSYRDSIIITPKAPETIDLGNDKNICKADTVNLIAPAGFASYSWLPVNNLEHPDDQITDAYPEITTKYYLYATKSPGCISVDSITINVNDLPQIHLPADSSICQGQSVLLDAGNGFASYNWNNGQTSSQITVNSSGNYNVVVTDANGCKASDSFQLIDVHALPTVHINQDRHLCIGESRTLSTINMANYTWLWQDGSSNATYVVTDTGFYKLTATDINTGCMAADSVHIDQFKNPPAFFLPNDSSMCIVQAFSIQPNKDFDSYIWSNGSTNKTITIHSPGIYMLQATDAFGCIGKDSIAILLKDCSKLIYFPTAFTPNNDGLNDIFRASFTTSPEKFNLSIYNRYGELVFNTSNVSSGWNGLYKGVQQNTGSFIWVAQYQFAGEKLQQHKGSFTLIR